MPESIIVFFTQPRGEVEDFLDEYGMKENFDPSTPIFLLDDLTVSCTATPASELCLVFDCEYDAESVPEALRAVIGKCEVIYSAFHDNSAASESQEKMLTALTTSKSLYPRCYSHEESDVLYNSLLELFKAIRSGDANAFQNRISSMAEIISGKYKSFPWRFEYFLELSLRLLAVDEESVSVVRNIIGCEGQPGQYELNCNLTETELEIFKELKLVIEAHLRSVQFKDMTDPQCYHRAIKILSDLSAEQKREYLRTPYLVR